MITFYTKPQCVQCDATKKALAKAGLDYALVDLTQNPESLQRVKEMGFAAAPVVIAEQDGQTVSWSGFHPDKIKQLTKILLGGLDVNTLEGVA